MTNMPFPLNEFKNDSSDLMSESTKTPLTDYLTTHSDGQLKKQDGE